MRDPKVKTPYTQRSYKENSRKPILTSMYLAHDLNNDTAVTLEELVDDGNTSAGGINVTAEVLRNLIEANLGCIHKQYPVSSFYATEQTIEADIYLL